MDVSEAAEQEAGLLHGIESADSASGLAATCC